MAGAAVDHTPQRRDVTKVAASGHSHVVLTGRMPAPAVVGRVEVHPTTAFRQVGQVGAHPGMRGIAAHQALLALGRHRQHVATHVARGQTQGAQTGNHDVRKVLAHAFALRQCLQCRGVDLGALALVREVGMDVLHQVDAGIQQRCAGAKAAAREGGKLGIARHKG